MGSSDTCRKRAFAFLFAEGANEELNSLQVVEEHAFPQHFSDMKRKVGLAPAAIVSTKGSDNSVLKSLDANRPLRANYPLIGKFFRFKSLDLYAYFHNLWSADLMFSV